MKKLIFALTALMITAQAEAKSTVVTAQLEQFKFQQGSRLAGLEIISGNITVDTKRKKIKLELAPKLMRCPEGVFCAQFIPQTISHEVDLKSAKVGGCGEVKYIGETDNRQGDGVRKEIVVIDNQNMICETFAPVALTEVSLTIEAVRPRLQEFHQMNGGKLDKKISKQLKSEQI